MVAHSNNTLTGFIGADLSLYLTYTPPVGEDRADLTMQAVLVGKAQAPIPASSIVFDTTTGAIEAIWEEEITRNLGSPAAYEARVMRVRDGVSRVFYTRAVAIK